MHVRESAYVENQSEKGESNEFIHQDKLLPVWSCPRTETDAAKQIKNRILVKPNDLFFPAMIIFLLNSTNSVHAYSHGILEESIGSFLLIGITVFNFCDSTCSLAGHSNKQTLEKIFLLIKLNTGQFVNEDLVFCILSFTCWASFPFSFL